MADDVASQNAVDFKRRHPRQLEMMRTTFRHPEHRHHLRHYIIIIIVFICLEINSKTNGGRLPEKPPGSFNWLPLTKLRLSNNIEYYFIFYFLFKHQRQRAQATYMPVK